MAKIGPTTLRSSHHMGGTIVGPPIKIWRCFSNFMRPVMGITALLLPAYSCNMVAWGMVCSR